MAKHRSNGLIVILSVLSFVVGFVFSAFAVVYFTLPDSSIIPAKRSNYSMAVCCENYNVETINQQDLSIHFLELGNKYTGDCTLIKVGNTEVLIDAGSKASSVPVIENYLRQFIADNTIEYVIVTHAHQDHIAGFATSKNTDSLFDLFNIGTVIQFVKTEKDPNKGLYKNYLRELEEVKTRCDTKVYNALQCIEETNGAQRIYDLSENVKLEILDQKFYHSAYQTNNENNNSVCCQIIQNNNKYYLFTGDLEEKEGGEASLVTLNSTSLHQVELYKAGHHGSKTSSSNTLLEVIQPKNVCVCCCAGSSEYTEVNKNQFPTQDFIDRIAPYTKQVFVTTLCLDYSGAGNFESMNGNVVFYCDNDATVVNVACSYCETVLKDTEWFKKNRIMPNNWKTV